MQPWAAKKQAVPAVINPERRAICLLAD